MEWEAKTDRYKTRFLFFPKTLLDNLLQKQITKWLCFATFRQIRFGGKHWMDWSWKD